MYPRQGLVPLFVIGGLLRPTVSRRNVADRVRFRCLDITTLLKIARPSAERSQFRFFVFHAISTVLFLLVPFSHSSLSLVPKQIIQIDRLSSHILAKRPMGKWQLDADRKWLQPDNRISNIPPFAPSNVEKYERSDKQCSLTILGRYHEPLSFRLRRRFILFFSSFKARATCLQDREKY